MFVKIVDFFFYFIQILPVYTENTVSVSAWCVISNFFGMNVCLIRALQKFACSAIFWLNLGLKVPFKLSYE